MESKDMNDQPGITYHFKDLQLGETHPEHIPIWVRKMGRFFQNPGCTNEETPFNVIQLLESDLHYCITEATSFKICKDALYKAFSPSYQFLAYLEYLPQMFSRNFRSCSDYFRKLKKVIHLANLYLAGSDDHWLDDTDLKAASRMVLSEMNTSYS